MKINRRKRNLKKKILELLRIKAEKKNNTIKEKQEQTKQHLFGLEDFGWFKKKVNSSTKVSDFRYTRGNFGHYGSKAADIFAGIAAIGLLIPLVIDTFAKNSTNTNTEPHLSTNLISDGWDFN